MLRRVVVGLVLLVPTGQTHAQTDALTEAAMIFAMGLVAYAECPALGYRVNASGWDALVQIAEPSVSLNDFGRNGRLFQLGRLATQSVAADVDSKGAGQWCANTWAWVHRKHPVVGDDIMKKLAP